MAPQPGIWDSQICVVSPAPSACAVFAREQPQPALAKYFGPESMRHRGASVKHVDGEGKRNVTGLGWIKAGYSAGSV